MNKVTTVNLNGRSYQLEEEGYEALKKYLDEARSALAQNPDCNEIISDLEQAIAEKCDVLLTPQKNVITTNEIAEILKAMGPVEPQQEGVKTEEVKSETKKPRRLYRIVDGSRIRGVCTGLAAYFNIDVILVRVFFIALTIITGGGFIVAYIILALVLPVARTADEIADAHGQPPFTAQDFVDRASNEFENFKKDESRHEWHQRMRAWRHEMHAERRKWRHEFREERRKRREEWHGSILGLVFAGVASSILWVLFIITVWSFLVYGTVFGYVIGAGLPIWVTLLFILLGFWLVALPLRAIFWSAGWRHHHHHFFGFGGLLWTILVLILFFYAASLLFPPVHIWWQQAVTYLQTVR